MKILLKFVLFGILILNLQFHSVIAQSHKNTFSTNYRNNLLWYLKPAQVWEEALPIGNGRLGAMIFGDPENDRLQLNEITLWSGDPQTDADRPGAYKYLDTIRSAIRDQDYPLAHKLTNQHFTSSAPYSSSYQTLGDLWLKFKLPNKQPATDYLRWLDIDQAIAGISFTSGGVNFKREIFSSAADHVLLQKITASRKGCISLTLNLNRIEDASTHFVAPNKLIMRGHAGGALIYEAQLTVVNKGGSVTASKNGIQVKNADDVLIYLTAGTSYKLDYAKLFKGPDPHQSVNRQMTLALAKPYPLLRAAHINEYQQYFRRVDFKLGGTAANDLPTDQRLKAYGDGTADPAFAALFYQYGRYLLISSSRPDNPLPSNSQGLWGDGLDLPWKCDYKSNINYEMNYWPAEQANLSELHMPMIRLTQALVTPGTKTAKTYYGPQTPGWYYGYTTNGWAWTSPGAQLSWGVFAGGSGWVCQHLWEHYAFSRDKKYLKSIYPVLKGAAQFYLATLIRDKNGYLVTSPSTSPENNFITDKSVKSDVTEGATMEKSIIWDLFTNVAQASSELNIDADFRKAVVASRNQLSPLRIGKGGQLMEWNEDWDLNSDDPHHRHTSHLFALHPGRQITALGTPALAQAAKRTLELRGDDGTGWALAWKENFWARLRQGDHAFKLLSNQLRFTTTTETVMADAGGTYANLFDAHPPFQIDGNFGAVSGITEMLLQSMESYQNAKGGQSYIIDLLPALPTAWGSGSITGLKARGGFEVALAWKAGKLVHGTIKSFHGEPFRIRTKYPLKISGMSLIPIKTNDCYLYTLTSKAGKIYQLSTM
ncbi:alpha-L-fucosidase 2 [Mucilaginibacter oryzae]|uniref:Alpha-L-fucosidase 2 n=1 Tax=Mucilaginibacter oryzae TaxID=468058 RepID=A0A316HEC4_9SPHI|nr:glycoside hydrolase family 95 protein [Mucilaginibacter oryzae]PWK79569.1 alpha-L-fucosidase 2 [Mucilaginibacter oryzae]